MDKICKRCGKEYTKLDNVLDLETGFYFCSPKCYLKWYRKKGLEEKT
jgi:hypothetical protein